MTAASLAGEDSGRDVRYRLGNPRIPLFRHIRCWRIYICKVTVLILCTESQVITRHSSDTPVFDPKPARTLVHLYPLKVGRPP